jgi:hypothetical protein
MKLLPYHRFSVQTHHPLTAVIDALEQYIEAPRLRSPFSRDHAPYTGTLSAKGFQIRRIIRYRNSFLPQIHGQFESIPQGTVVHVRMSLHPFVIAFSLVWFIIYYTVITSIVLSTPLLDSLTYLVPLLFLAPLPIFGIVGWVFGVEAKRSETDLTQIIQGHDL